MSVLRDGERPCLAPDNTDVGDVGTVSPIPFAVGERRCGDIDKPRITSHFHKRRVIEIRRLADLERIARGTGGGQPAERRGIHRDNFFIVRRIGEILPEDWLAIDTENRCEKLWVVKNSFLADGQDGCIVPMGFARRKPVVELEFDLDSTRWSDEQETTDLRPFIDDREEFLLDENFLFVCVKPMDTEAWTGIVRGFHFRRATIPCGDDYSDGILRQRLTLNPRFSLLVGIATADGKFVTCMAAERSDVERAACAEVVFRPTDEGVFLDVFKTGVFQKFGT